jgi:hypothetical protein
MTKTKDKQIEKRNKQMKEQIGKQMEVRNKQE